MPDCLKCEANAKALKTAAWAEVVSRLQALELETMALLAMVSHMLEAVGLGKDTVDGGQAKAEGSGGNGQIN